MVPGLNLIYIENITNIRTTFLPITYLDYSSFRDQLSIDTKNINKQTNKIYVENQQTNNKNGWI